MQKRTEISFASIVLCLLVMFIHISSQPVSALNRDSVQFLTVLFPWRLSAFVVQGFIFLSSLKYFLRPPITDYRSFYLGRIKTIFLPYVLWTVIYYFFFYFAGYYSLSLADFCHYLLLGNIVSPFYFIIIILQFYALMPLWQKLFRSFDPIVLLALSFAITVLFPQSLPPFLAKFGITLSYTDRMFPTYLLYWVLGGVCGLREERIKQFWKKRAFLLVTLCAAFGILDLYYTYQTYVFGVSVPFLETLHIFYCVFAIFAVMCVGIYVSEGKWMRLAPYTFTAYLSHCLFLNLINFFMQAIGITDIGLSYFLRFVFVYLATLFFCFLLQTCKQRLFQKKGAQ